MKQYTNTDGRRLIEIEGQLHVFFAGRTAWRRYEAQPGDAFVRIVDYGDDGLPTGLADVLYPFATVRDVVLADAGWEQVAEVTG